MKIDFSTITEEYLEEVLYIATYISKFIKKPRKRVYQLNKFYTFYLYFSMIYLLLFGLLYLYYKDMTYIYFSGIFTFLLFLVSILLIKNKIRVKSLLNNSNKRVIEFNKDDIKYIDDMKSLTIEWSSIKNILINTHSIVFLPINNMLPIITLGIQHYDDVLKVLKKYNKEELIIKKKTKQ